MRPLLALRRLSVLALGAAAVAASFQPRTFTGPATRGSLRPAVLREAGGSASLSIKGAVEPLADYVLVRIGKPEETTKGGLVLPSRRKPQEGEVVAVGPGARNSLTGKVLPVSVAPGRNAVYGKSAYFDTFNVDGLEHALLREDQILLSYEGSELMPESVSMPRGRVLVKLVEKKQETDSGLLLSKSSAGTSSQVGEVIAVGEGAHDGGFHIATGELVRFRYGDEVKFSAGPGKEKYMSVSFSECIAKASAPVR